MNVHEALDELDKRGCGRDPVVFRGEEMDVRDTSDRVNPLKHASRVVLTYQGLRGRVVNGTLQAMVKDRREPANLTPIRRRRAHPCPSCRCKP